MHGSKEQGEGIPERGRSGWEGESVGCSRVTSVWGFPRFLLSSLPWARTSASITSNFRQNPDFSNPNFFFLQISRHNIFYRTSLASPHGQNIQNHSCHLPSLSCLLMGQATGLRAPLSACQSAGPGAGGVCQPQVPG